MLLWFLAGAALIVWQVFGDPTIDYRLVMLGAVLPDLIDGPFGGARVAHGVLASVALLVVVMLVTVGRKARRRRWLALPIGTFLHLVLDGAWGSTRVFWWPLAGTSFEGARLPSIQRGWWSALLELIGLAGLAWAWRRFGFKDAGLACDLCPDGSARPEPSPLTGSGPDAARGSGTC